MQAPAHLKSLALLVLPALLPGQVCESRVRLDQVWDFLVTRYDKNKDSKITKAEFTRGEKQFFNHDRNGDGVIDRKDYPEGGHWNGFGPNLLRNADRDRDGGVSKREWAGMRARLDPDKDGEISAAEAKAMFGPMVARKPKLFALSFDSNGDGKLQVADFQIIFDDMDLDGDGSLDAQEMRRNRFLGERGAGAAPRKGAEAPTFRLPRLEDPKQEFDLAEARKSKPVALIFGSYT